MRFWSRAVIAAGLCIGLGGCRKIIPPLPLEELNAQQAHGHEVFQARCARCHYDRKDRPLHGPSLLNVYKRPELPSGAPANDERVTQAVLHGRGMMPAMGHLVGSEEMDDLLAYLHTL